MESSLLIDSQKSEKQEFRDITATPQRFFDILPSDWQGYIVPCWSDYAQTARIYTLEAKQKVIAGGIIFSTIPPDTLNEVRAQELFSQGLLYIGFLWVPEELRGCNLGSKWIDEVRSEYNDKSFWLTIDEQRLASFYKKNGFHAAGEFLRGDTVEWVMADTSV